MKRDVFNEFNAWKQDPRRKPLVLMGARQVGKTWLMRDYGKRNFARVHEFNFDGATDLASLFADSKKPDDLLRKLSIIGGKKINPAEDLVIFDEVQECPDALNSLKYFNEDCPELAIMAAGSLLGVRLGRRKGAGEGNLPTSYPVGKVELMDVEPMSFGECLRERDPALYEYWRSISGSEPLDEIFHHRLLDAYDEYLIVGGMPECVGEFLSSGDIETVRKTQRDLLALYEDDIVKHNGPIDAAKVLVVLRSLVPQLAKANGKFVYGVAREGARAREYEGAIEWLVSARMVRRTHNVTSMTYPLAAQEIRNAFKLYHLDVGLVRELAEVQPKSIALNEDFAFKGRLAENYVLQQLHGRSDGAVRYWAEREEKEIDFVLQHEGEIVPVEVKSGEDRKASTFKNYVKAKSPRWAIRFSRRNLRKDGGFVNIPLYLAERFAACLD